MRSSASGLYIISIRTWIACFFTSRLFGTEVLNKEEYSRMADTVIREDLGMVKPNWRLRIIANDA